MARPTKYKKKYCESFITLSRQGKNLAQIAYEWNVERKTIYNWSEKHEEFLHAIKKGREFCEAWYINIGQAAMTGTAMIGTKKMEFNLGAYVWLTKNIFKWSDRIEQSIDTESDVVIYETQFATNSKKNS